MNIPILEKCHCCGQSVDITLPENKGLVINRKASLGAQIVIVEDALKRAKGVAKAELQRRFDDLQSELRTLP